MSKLPDQYCDRQYFRFQKVDDYFADFVSWDRIVKVSGCACDRSGGKLTLHLVSAEGREGDMYFEAFNGRSFRFRFHPCRKAEEYSAYNTRAIVQDTFEETIKFTANTAAGDLRTEFKEAEGKYAEMEIREDPSDGALIVHADFDPFALTVYKTEAQPDGEKKYVVFHAPEDSLRFKPAGGFDDYHIALTARKQCTAKYVGFGEQGGKALVKNNTRVTYFNYDNMRYRQVYGRGPLEEREPLYHSDPFFMEVNGQPELDSVYGIYIDNPSEVVLDMGYYRSDSYRFGIRYGVLDCYFFTGRNCGDVIERFCDLCGNPRIIPRYALGYHQGCYGYEKREDLHEVVRKYRECGIPLDGLHVDVDIQKDYKTFTINEDKFNDPKDMFAQLRKQGVKCSTNITPIISNRNAAGYSTYQEGIESGYFVADERLEADNPDGKIYYKYGEGTEYEQPFLDPEENYNTGKPFIGEVYYGSVGPVELGTTGHYPDLNRREVRDWWGKQYAYLFEQGLEMVWQDMTTPCLRETRGDMLSFPSRLLVDNDFVKDPSGGYDKTPVMRIWNLYSYNLHKATYHGLNNLECRKNKRNFIVGRGCFTGMQRFAALWTGDNSSSWDFLRINISQVLALGLTGQALAGQDIGGFECDHDGEQWADPELLIRWTAMGAFLPWFRNHYIRKGKKLFQEPYAYQSVADQVPAEDRPMYESVLPVCKYYIELRYRLLQLFYDAMWENALSGLPICRTLFLTDPADKALFNDREGFLDNEFMVRQDLLIAPMLEKESDENGHGKRDVYLPAGSRWYQFVDNRCPLPAVIEGGTNVCEFDAHISSEPGHIPYIVPMYVREGAVIPTIELEQYVGEKNEKGQPNIITLNVYPGDRGQYTMYLDDGVSRSSQPLSLKTFGIDPEANDEYREVHISHQWTDKETRRISIKRVHDKYTPKYEKYFRLAVLHEAAEADRPVKEIRINGQSITEVNTKEAFDQSGADAWFFEPAQKISYVKVIDDKEDVLVDVIYSERR